MAMEKNLLFLQELEAFRSDPVEWKKREKFLWKHLIHNGQAKRDQRILFAYQWMLKKSNSFAKGIIESRLGDLFRYQGDWNSSLLHYLRALEQHQDVSADGSIYFNVSFLFSQLQDDSTARCFLFLARNVPKHLPLKPFLERFQQFPLMPISGRTIGECLVAVGMLKEQEISQNLESFLQHFIFPPTPTALQWDLYVLILKHFIVHFSQNLPQIHLILKPLFGYFKESESQKSTQAISSPLQMQIEQYFSAAVPFNFHLLKSSKYFNSSAEMSFHLYFSTLWKRYFQYNSSLATLNVQQREQHLIFDTSSLIEIESREVFWRILAHSRFEIVIPSGVLSELKKLATVKEHKAVGEIYKFITKASNLFKFISPSGKEISFAQAFSFKYSMNKKLQCMDDHILQACQSFLVVGGGRQTFLVTDDRQMSKKASSCGMGIYSSHEIVCFAAELTTLLRGKSKHAS